MNKIVARRQFEINIHYDARFGESLFMFGPEEALVNRSDSKSYGEDKR